MKNAGFVAAVGAVIIMALILMVLGPVVVALSLGALFALPFWPSFWLAVGVALTVGVARVPYNN